MSSTRSTDAPCLSFGPDSPPVRRIVVPIVPDTGHDRGLEVAQEWAVRWRLPVHLLAVETDGSGSVDTTRGQRLDHARDRLASATVVLP